MAEKPRIRTRPPKYRRHSSGQARVTIQGQDYLLGAYGTAESKEKYRRLVAEYLASEGRFAPKKDAPAILVNEVIICYWRYARTYYGFEENSGRGDAACLKDALRVLRALYGNSEAANFGPKALKACRASMIAMGWSRGYINSQIARIRRAFTWAVAEELIPASVPESLKTVPGLRKGKSEAREKEPIKPVPPETVEATLPHLSTTIQGLVKFQLLTGCRPAEACDIRPRDIDKQNPNCWVFIPGSDKGEHGAHKTAHHGHARLILIGPKAQEVLTPFLEGIEADAYCFSPIRAVAERSKRLREERKTPLTPSQLARGKKGRRQRAPQGRYPVGSYRNAIQRACRRAGIAIWHPNQLRHTRATALRSHGLDVVKTILGHTKIETSQIYAEKDLAAAMAVVAATG